jgi:hypothetical protein
MTTRLPLIRRMLDGRVPVIIALAAAISALAIVLSILVSILWSIVLSAPQLIAPTRWLEAWRTFA